MSEVRLVTDGAKMAQLLRSPTGPVGRHLIERATVVQMAAKAQAPRRTGCLQDSIVKRVEENPATGFLIRIVSDTSPCSPERKSYSYYVHEGTQPHVIEAKDGGALSFEWHGERVFFKRVNHPGVKANRFLSDSLHLVVA